MIKSKSQYYWLLFMAILLISCSKGHVVIEEKSDIKSFCISQDGNVIATHSEDNTVRIWNHRGELAKVLKWHSTGFQSMALSSQGTYLLVQYFRDAKLYTLDEKLLGSFENTTYSNFIPSDGRIITVEHENYEEYTVSIWNESGDSLARNKIYSSDFDIKYLDLNDRFFLIEHELKKDSLGLSKNKNVVIVDYNGEIQKSLVIDRQQSNLYFRNQRLKLSPDGKSIYEPCKRHFQDCEYSRMYDRQGKLLDLFPHTEGFEFSADGEYIILLGYDKDFLGSVDLFPSIMLYDIYGEKLENISSGSRVDDILLTHSNRRLLYRNENEIKAVNLEKYIEPIVYAEIDKSFRELPLINQEIAGAEKLRDIGVGEKSSSSIFDIIGIILAIVILVIGVYYLTKRTSLLKANIISSSKHHFTPEFITVVSRIEELIKQGKIEKAVDLYLENLEKVGNSEYREVLAYKARLNYLNQKYRKGTLKTEDEKVEINTMVDSFLMLVSELKNKFEQQRTLPS